MDKNKSSSPREYADQSEYQTGFAQVPKGRSGLIAFLLVVIILLGSIVGLLGMMNIHLFQQLDALSSQSTAPVRFSEDGNSIPSEPGNTTAPAEEPSGILLTPIPGISGYILSDLEQELYQLPQGFCVTQVDAQHSLFPGDILLSLDGVAIDQADTFSNVLSRVGDTVSATVYRSGTQCNISIHIP